MESPHPPPTTPLTAPLTADDARLILRVAQGADPATVSRAFRAAVKRVHPDRPGGDHERLRLVIAAYHRLKPEAPMRERAPRPPKLRITPEDALLGGWRLVRLGGAEVQLQLPAGLRPGEQVQVDGGEAVVVIVGSDDLAVLGDHLCLTARLEPQVMRHGGRLLIDTPRGTEALWVSRRDIDRGMVRVAGAGLPARAGYAAGALLIRLAAKPKPEPQTLAQAKLRKFAAAWAA